MTMTLKEFLFSEQGIKLGVICLRKIYQELDFGYTMSLAETLYPDISNREEPKLSFIIKNAPHVGYKFIRKEYQDDSISDLVLDRVLYTIRDLLSDVPVFTEEERSSYNTEVDKLHEELKKRSENV